MHTEAQAKVLADLEDHIARLSADTRTDWVLAWDNHLGVAFDPAGKPYACGLDHAATVATDDMPEEAWAYTPDVRNGAGVRANVVKRQAAIKADIAHTHELIAHFS